MILFSFSKSEPFFYEVLQLLFLLGRLYSVFLQIFREHLQQDSFHCVKKWVLEYCFVKSEKRVDLEVIKD